MFAVQGGRGFVFIFLLGGDAVFLAERPWSFRLSAVVVAEGVYCFFIARAHLRFFDQDGAGVQVLSDQVLSDAHYFNQHVLLAIMCYIN